MGNRNLEIPKDVLSNLYWNQRLSLQQVSLRLDCSVKRIFYWMRKYGLRRRTLSEAHRGKRKINLNVSLLSQLYYDKKMTLEEIGEQLACSLDTVRRRIAEAGMPIRKSSESARIRGSFLGRNNPVYSKHIWKNKPHPRGMLGKTSWNKGKSWSEKARKQMSLTRKDLFQSGKVKPWNTGVPCSEGTRKKISEANKGKEIWWKTKGHKQNPCIKQFATKPELKFKELCEINLLPFRFTGDGSFWVSNMNPDFVHLYERVVVEIFGNYWHNPVLNPSIRYNSTLDGRKAAFEKGGWKVIFFWDFELMSKDAENIVLERLKSEGIL